MEGTPSYKTTGCLQAWLSKRVDEMLQRGQAWPVGEQRKTEDRWFLEELLALASTGPVEVLDFSF